MKSKLRTKNSSLQNIFRAINDPKILLVDCRSRNEFSEGVIKSENWMNVPHFEVRKYFRSEDAEFKGIRRQSVVLRREAPGVSLA